MKHAVSLIFASIIFCAFSTAAQTQSQPAQTAPAHAPTSQVAPTEPQPSQPATAPAAAANPDSTSGAADAVPNAASNSNAPASKPAERPVVLMTGYSDLHHPTSAKNPEAQKFFDQGLRQVYAFNHDEAARSFQHAVDLEPSLAIAYWGVAEAIGPNYNDPADDARFKQAHDLMVKATELADSTNGSATASERDYIAAMSKRFPAPGADLHKAAEDYRDAMRELVKKYPDDLDAATLFAEAGMNLHPWGLWHADGTPEEGTQEIVSTLESVIRRDPTHLGAMHYYIHAVEASQNPQLALADAQRLASLAPGAGHIVHMPAHIYIRTGDYAAAVSTNEKAAAVDETYIKETGTSDSMYSMMYYGHNLHFIAISGAMDGDYADAHAAAVKLYRHVSPYIKEMPLVEAYMTIDPVIDVRFHRWDDVLKIPTPDPSLKMLTAIWHYSRGMAFAGKGKIADALAEHKALAQIEQETPADADFTPLNKAKAVLTVADDTLAAKIAMARGKTEDAISKLRAAVAAQDALNYDEPPDWYFPVRESLGAALLKSGDAAAAEKVFREDLDRNPRNPRSLFGLAQSLKKEGHAYDAQFVDAEFHRAWKGDPGRLTISDLI